MDNELDSSSIGENPCILVTRTENDCLVIQRATVLDSDEVEIAVSLTLPPVIAVKLWNLRTDDPEQFAKLLNWIMSMHEKYVLAMVQILNVSIDDSNIGDHLQIAFDSGIQGILYQTESTLEMCSTAPKSGLVQENDDSDDDIDRRLKAMMG